MLQETSASTSQLLSNIENAGVLLARSLDNSSNKSVNATIERTNIGKGMNYSKES